MADSAHDGRARERTQTQIEKKKRTDPKLNEFRLLSIQPAAGPGLCRCYENKK